MTAENIREHWHDAEMQTQHQVLVGCSFYLAEVAAQLAELNANLKSVTEGPAEHYRAAIRITGTDEALTIATDKPIEVTHV